MIRANTLETFQCVMTIVICLLIPPTKLLVFGQTLKSFEDRLQDV